MFRQIKFVLVETSHPGNIGGVARAIKNMGFHQLCLVAPRAQFPHPKASLQSSGADDILADAQVVDNLQEAIADCTLVVGASARSRHLPWPLMSPREFAQQAQTELAANQRKLAVVLGREDRGLSNEELHLCHFHVQIPCNPEFSSLNIAAACQVLAYELRVAILDAEAKSEQRITAEEANQELNQQQLNKQTSAKIFGTEWDSPLATQADLARLFTHFEEALTELNFLDPKNPKQLMPRLQRLLLRARPDQLEVNILRGILTASQKAARQTAKS